MTSLATTLSQPGGMWSFVSLAPYAIGLVFFAFLYFLVIPYVEYLRDPKGMTSYRSHDDHWQKIANIYFRLAKIPQSLSILRILSDTFHADGWKRFPIKRTIRVTQEAPRHSNWSQHALLW